MQTGAKCERERGRDGEYNNKKRGSRDLSLFARRSDQIRMFRLSLLSVLLLAQSSQCALLGWVESPGYPSGYPPHSSLNWSRCAPRGHTLSVRLLHLDLEDSQDCENDALKVFSNGGLISVLCGNKDLEELRSVVNPTLVSSAGGCLSITFHSDFSNTKRHTGFRGFYTVQDFDECEDDPNNQCSQFCHNFIGGYHCSCRHGYLLAEDKHTCTVSCSEDLSGQNHGDVSSPSWPGSYAENADCVSTLSVENHQQLELHFSDVFDVEQSPDGQCIDALRVETPSITLGPFCGSSPPPSPLLTHSHHVRIRFTSDGFGTNRGFSLNFRTRGKVCPAAVTSHSTVSPQRAEHHPGQTVTVTCSVGHVVNSHWVDALTSQFEATCDVTGTWTPSYTCEPVDCGFPNVPKDGILQLVGSEPPHTQYKDQIQFNCSSEYYRLDGDDTYSCNASGEWTAADGTTTMPECTAVCGQTGSFFSGAGRILGGQEAKLGQIPWQLLIRRPNRGGASLISDRWAVTAAHVVDGVEQTSLVLFGGLVDGRTAGGPGVAVLQSERIIIHPGYATGTNSGRINYDNDIALIRFASRVNFGPNLLPICLPEPNRGVWENEQGTVSGWGMTHNQQKSPLLNYAHIVAYSLNECQQTPTFSNKAVTFTNNMFCAGAHGKDSCYGDSGGPFVLPMLSSDGGPYVLAGVVSWGAPCRGGHNKGYYTKVENYVEWIKQTIRTEDGS
uniref:Complement component 1, s subcomponent n=1 Tax=Stegastes partitus TaxID=144197 RepID=A0A3B4Z8V7_9TELE